MKCNMGNKPLLYPVPVVLVGALVNGKPNYTTVGDCAIMGLNPALVCISLNQGHYSTQGIMVEKIFSINLPTVDMLKVVDYCGMVSGKDHDKSVLFTNFTSETGAPMIEECPVNLECRVVQEVVIQHRHIFIAEVVKTWVDSGCLKEQHGKNRIQSLDALKPIVYALDNRYYAIGEAIGIGYQEGKAV